MATVYSLFFGFLFIAVCSISCGSSANLISPQPPEGGIVAYKGSGNCTEGPEMNSINTKSEQETNVNKFHSSNNLTSAENVASAGPGLQEARDVIASRYSDAVEQAKILLKQNVRSPVNKDRNKIINIATAELGVREATGQNDGKRVEEYLAYANLGKGHAWCAAFVSWCYGRAGLPAPRNPWSPALFPNTRTYWKQGKFTDVQYTEMQLADVFGIYGRAAKRINHVGLVKKLQGKYLVTIEGNSNNRVESRRRHLSTVYALANWVNQLSDQ